MELFKENGYTNIIGIDIVKECEDCIVMDAKKTRFDDNEFDLVFAEGFLEHFHDLHRTQKRCVG